MIRLDLAADSPATVKADAVVIGIHSVADEDAIVLAAGAESVDKALGGTLARTLRQLGATGSAGEVTKLASLGATTAPVVATVGLGAEPDEDEIELDVLRRAAGAVVRALKGTGHAAVALPYASLDALGAVAEGAQLGGYEFAAYKTPPPNGQKEPLERLTLLTADKAAKAEIERANTVAEAVLRARDWVNVPGNLLRPPALAEAMSEAVSGSGAKVEVLDEKALRAGGYGGILAVGEGSEAPPRLVRVTYAPRGAKKHVALVGKGITFDTGGISIKPLAGMGKMKSDMAGAAAVVNTIVAAALLKLKVKITAYAPLAENMLSGSAYRPGDVVTMYGGKTVEIINTDAEGRMVLGDAIARAAEDDPDYLVETSTLTGGQVVALGNRTSGVMGSEEFRTRVVETGDRVGENMWPMPLPEDVRSGMDSPIADVSQTNNAGERAGHMLQGGAFLAEYVPEGLDWAHIDIAGPSYHSGGAYGYVVAGGTGVPVRTLLALLTDIATES
ncbi:leucyl aminopeptidase [Fodinicola acaciae]|uniref:leucyl aminopeptidase n=1 Tax=Fodinicola acaciae TaxID=2681555 RepID=UPI001FE2C3FC|nr:leucyl aminopeptidase [Fodinicola acaciae]